MSRTDDCIDVIVLAGGRIRGAYSQAAHTSIKALAPIAGTPVVDLLATALRGAPCIQRICLVGPESVRDATQAADIWTHDEGSVMDNLRTGIESLGSTTRRVLVTACDLPLVSSKAITGFVQGASIDAEICLPLITQVDFDKRFPDNNKRFVNLHDGGIAIGSMAIVDSRIISANLKLLGHAMAHRGSAAGMAMTLGLAFMFKLMRGKLSVSDIEERASALTECRCKVVRGVSPSLAFDIDTVDDYHDACKRMRRLLLERSQSKPGSGMQSPQMPSRIA
ncbi:MAG TPA: NTP transferase domain-containing protein [Capsulimonadaceae bacterium]|jgi:GTP:adenosylcobinamide-phosphate guanylyltransferase